MKVLCNTIQKFSQSPWKTELESNAFMLTLHWLVQSQGGSRGERVNMRGVAKLANRADCLVWLEVFLMATWGQMCCWTALWGEGDREEMGGFIWWFPSIFTKFAHTELTLLHSGLDHKTLSRSHRASYIFHWWGSSLSESRRWGRVLRLLAGAPNQNS